MISIILRVYLYMCVAYIPNAVQKYKKTLNYTNILVFFSTLVLNFQLYSLILITSVSTFFATFNFFCNFVVGFFSYIMFDYKIIYPEDFSNDRIDEMIASLPEWRREECLRFKHRQGQLENALAYHLLSDMVGCKLDFLKGEHGKPMIDEGAKRKMLYFNLSHCRQAVACVVSDTGEVGIDVESLGRYKPQLAAYCMSDGELQQINGAEDADAEFTLLWTKKESLLKMTGEGITDDMKNCLASARADGVEIECGIDKERGYAWSVAHRSS